MKLALAMWGIVMFICFLEAYFCSKLDSESQKLLKNRENERKDKHLYK